MRCESVFLILFAFFLERKQTFLFTIEITIIQRIRQLAQITNSFDMNAIIRIQIHAKIKEKIFYIKMY